MSNFNTIEFFFNPSADENNLDCLNAILSAKTIVDVLIESDYSNAITLCFSDNTCLTIESYDWFKSISLTSGN